MWAVGSEPKYPVAAGMSAFGGRPDQGLRRLRQPLLTDSVEKVLVAVGIKFLRAADAFNAVGHGGPRRFERKLSATFFFA